MKKLFYPLGFAAALIHPAAGAAGTEPYPSSGTAVTPAPSAGSSSPNIEAAPAVDGAATEPEVTNTVPVASASVEAVGESPDGTPERIGMGIEEIVVTAQKREENINTVPISISAFSGDDLKALGVTNTQDLANLVPGFTAADSGYNTPIYTLRGVGFNDSTYTATSTVGVYVDEVNLPYSIMTKGASLDLQRVEVLKGPQGILYGRNTTGGAINYIAKKPTDTFEAGVTGTFGRFDTVDTEGFISGPLTDSIKGRLAVKVTEAFAGDQYSNTRPGDTLGKKNKQAFRGAVDWAATDDLKFRVVTEGWWDHSDARAAQVIQVREQNGLDPTHELFLPPQARGYPVISQNDADPRVADWPDQEPWKLDDHFLLGALRSDWQISDRVSFTALGSYMRVASDGSEIPATGYNFNNAEQILAAHINTASLEARFSGVFGDSDEFDWMVGGNASKDSGLESHFQLLDMQSALASDPVTGRSALTDRVVSVGDVKIDQVAGFFNTGWKFADDFKLSIGGRYTQQNEDYTGCSFVSPESSYDLLSGVFTGLSTVDAAQYTAQTGQPGQPSVVTTGQCFTLAADGSNKAFSSSLDENNFSYRVALDWQPVKDSLFYVSAGRGYKAGGFPVTNASNQGQYKPVTQEELLAYEVGTKLTFFEHQLRANSALYYYDYKNKQLLTKTRDPFFGPLPVLQNAPKSAVYGAELDLQFAPAAINGLFIAATGAYTHTEIKQFEGLDSSGNDFNFAGRPFNFAPELQVTILGNYTQPISDHLNVTAGADYYHSSSTSSALDADPIFKHMAYGLVGARVGVASADGVWSLMAFGRNLTNEFYTISAIQTGDSVARYTGAPRTYGITLNWNWF